MKYRREVDGLRAVALVPVILFHAGFQTFSGGFVGVDVFFVISGYLITSIILAEKQAGTFTLAGFYERRARRILPALFFVMLATLPFAWLYLLPHDLKDFARSITAVSIFSSNFLFARQSGYFDTAAELKPLLHTWSLAVEEQYYIIFPLLLLMIWRFGRRGMIGILALLAMASLVFAQWGSIHQPASTFYLLPTRGWELLLGVFTAFYLERTTLPHGRLATRQILGLAGLAMIFLAVFLFDRSTPFPGAYALIPTLGTVLIILFATPETFAGRILASKVLVGIGLISYSAYLWHVPLFVFARHGSTQEPSQYVFITLSLFTVLLAIFSWRYVEKPFRQKGLFSRRFVMVFSILGVLLFAATGYVVKQNEDRFSRLTEEQERIYSFARLKDPGYREGTCFLRREQPHTEFADFCVENGSSATTLVWGDSHAAALSVGLRSVVPGLAQLTSAGCPPLVGAEIAGRPNCKKVNDYILHEIDRIKPREVILHANWMLYREPDIELAARETVRQILKTSPASRVVLVGGMPQWNPSLPIAMIKHGIPLNAQQYLKSDTYSELIESDQKFSAIARQDGFLFFSLAAALCNHDACLATVDTGGQVSPIVWDVAHLTEGGSLFLARKYLELKRTSGKVTDRKS